MEHMDKLRDMLCEELEEITRKGELGAGDLEIAHKLTDTIKNIDKIEMFDEDYSREYSRGGDWAADMRGTYGRGNSYRRHYVRGHYSRTGDLRGRLEDMMHETNDDRVKDALRRAMNMIEG